MIPFRLWLAGLLAQLAAWVHPAPTALPHLAFVVAPIPRTPLQQEARCTVRRLHGEPFSSVSKRQVVFRELQARFPGVGASDLNFAIEEAVRDLPRERPAAAAQGGDRG